MAAAHHQPNPNSPSKSPHPKVAPPTPVRGATATASGGIVEVSTDLSDEIVEHVGPLLVQHPIHLLSWVSALIEQFHDWETGHSSLGDLAVLPPIEATVEHDAVLVGLSVLAPDPDDRARFETIIDDITVGRWKRLPPWLRGIDAAFRADGRVETDVPCHFLQINLGYWQQVVLIAFLGTGDTPAVDDVVAVPSALLELVGAEGQHSESLYDPAPLAAALDRTRVDRLPRTTATWPGLRALVEWAIRDAREEATDRAG